MRIQHLLPRLTYPLWKLDSQTRSLASITDAFGPPPIEPQRRVVVTGLGLVTPLGVGVSTAWDRLLSGATAVRALTPEDLPESHRVVYDQLPSKVIAAVPTDQLNTVPWAPQVDTKRTARFMHFALIAAAEALKDANWHPNNNLQQQQTTGVAIGSGMSGTTDMADADSYISGGKLRRMSPFFVPRVLPNMAAGIVSIAFGLQGPNHSVSTACATGAHSIGDAFRMVQRGDADVMVAGGTESCVDGIALGGFSRLKALSTGYNDNPPAASRPFDEGRDGFVMGEGAGVLVLEEREHALQRGAKIYAEIRGYGLSGDAHHITQPPPDGAGAQLAMQRALQIAGITPEQVCYVNAHATSTPTGDDIEQRAIAAVFGLQPLKSGGSSNSEEYLAVSSTKGATGHLLGAAGAVEGIFSILAAYHGVAPVTVNLEKPSPAVLPGLVGSGGGKGSRYLPAGPRAVLSNSFGFGGTNAALLFTSEGKE